MDAGDAQWTPRGHTQGTSSGHPGDAQGTPRGRPGDAQGTPRGRPGDAQGTPRLRGRPGGPRPPAPPAPRPLAPQPPWDKEVGSSAWNLCTPGQIDKLVRSYVCIYIYIYIYIYTYIHIYTYQRPRCELGGCEHVGRQHLIGSPTSWSL